MQPTNTASAWYSPACAISATEPAGSGEGIEGFVILAAPMTPELQLQRLERRFFVDWAGLAPLELGPGPVEQVAQFLPMEMIQIDHVAYPVAPITG